MALPSLWEVGTNGCAADHDENGEGQPNAKHHEALMTDSEACETAKHGGLLQLGAVKG